MIPARRLALALSVVAALCASAAPSHARILIGFEGGFRYGDVSRDDLLGLDARHRPAWSLGVVGEAPVAGGLSLVTGTRYLAHQDAYLIDLGGTAFDPNGGTLHFDSETTLHYLTLPVRLAARPAGGLVLEGGTDVGYLLDADTETAFHDPSIALRSSLRFARIFEELGTLDDDDPYRRWNVALAAGMGWDFRSTERVMTLRLRYEHGLTRLHPNEDLRRHTRAVTLDAGVRW